MIFILGLWSKGMEEMQFARSHTSLTFRELL